MERYQSIGTCSGVPQEGNIWKGRSSNGAIIYRRECWDDIGGFHPIPAWDTHAILKSYFKGWCSIAFSHIKYYELRTSERTNLREWYYSGQARFLMGFPFYHSLGVFIIHAKKKPPFLGSLLMCLTHLLQIVGRRTKPFSKSYYDYVKKHAWWEIKVRMRGRFLI